MEWPGWLKCSDSLSCKSKNFIYLIECKKCAIQYIGETKRQLKKVNERFGEHRRSILNHNQLINPTPTLIAVSTKSTCHFTLYPG